MQNILRALLYTFLQKKSMPQKFQSRLSWDKQKYFFCEFNNFSCIFINVVV